MCITLDVRFLSCKLLILTSMLQVTSKLQVTHTEKEARWYNIQLQILARSVQSQLNKLFLSGSWIFFSFSSYVHSQLNSLYKLGLTDMEMTLNVAAAKVRLNTWSLIIVDSTRASVAWRFFYCPGSGSSFSGIAEVHERPVGKLQDFISKNLFCKLLLNDMVARRKAQCFQWYPAAGMSVDFSRCHVWIAHETYLPVLHIAFSLLHNRC